MLHVKEFHPIRTQGVRRSWSKDTTFQPLGKSIMQFIGQPLYKNLLENFLVVACPASFRVN